MLSKSAFDALGPVFASHGWVFLGPYRRGRGVSASAGPFPWLSPGLASRHQAGAWDNQSLDSRFQTE
jgi:hypothetical protein